MLLKDIQLTTSVNLRTRGLERLVRFHAIHDSAYALDGLNGVEDGRRFGRRHRSEKCNPAIFDDDFNVGMGRHTADLRSDAVREDGIANLFMLEDSFRQPDESLQSMRRIPGGDVTGSAKDLCAMDCGIFGPHPPPFPEHGIC